MNKKRMCVVSTKGIREQLNQRIQKRKLPFTPEEWIMSNLGEIKTIPMSFIPNHHYAKGTFEDLIKELNDTIDIPITIDQTVDCKFVGTTLLILF